MNSQKSPSPSRIFLTSATPFIVSAGPRSAGTTSSSWNCTPSKPSFLYSRILAANATSLRTSGPNGSRPWEIFQGPKVKRYLVAGINGSPYLRLAFAWRHASAKPGGRYGLFPRDVQTIDVLLIAQVE